MDVANVLQSNEHQHVHLVGISLHIVWFAVSSTFVVTFLGVSSLPASPSHAFQLDHTVSAAVFFLKLTFMISFECGAVIIPGFANPQGIQEAC